MALGTSVLWWDEPSPYLDQGWNICVFPCWLLSCCLSQAGVHPLPLGLGLSRPRLSEREPQSSLRKVCVSVDVL